ncbi:MAG TPA: hypothetical protein VGJ18_10160 [Gemmatimonadaceae bacterium]
MHGDLSTPFTTRDINFAGILEQQGRVSLDADTNAATAIALDWQDIEANDVIGSGVAAIPADAPDSFLVTSAQVDGAGKVRIVVNGGRAWVDGTLVRLEGTPPIGRVATYLQPPVVPAPAPDATSIAAGVRDAVILEVYREALSSFQRPGLLLEPALGGPDTIERIHTSFDFRLLRLAAGDDCGNLGPKLDDNLAARGHLTVSLKKTTTIPGPCPVNDAGGYTGFEHALYRIEIADVNAGAPMFKWSQFNGGLVGRADFDGGAGIARILSNLQPIITAGLPSFYLETLEPDTDSGGAPIFDRWRVTYGAGVTLNANDELVLGPTVFGAGPPPKGSPTFFRLWNAIRGCGEFPTGGVPNELIDGICLAFDPNAVGAYTPGDYWTFDVRAGNIAIDPLIIGGVQVLVNDEPPAGIRRHRVSLGIVTWPSAMPAAGTISDCREVFQPLTRLDTCCTFRVGDGVHSHGQFTSIQTAVQHLPAAGGKICVLPGVYNEHVLIDTLENVIISGCGKRSHVIGDTADPVFHIRDSWHITIEDLFIEAPDDANGILVDTAETDYNRDIKMRRLIVAATTASAIDVEEGTGVTIRESFISMADVPTEWPAIFFIADNGLIERNVVRVGAQDGIDEAFWVTASAGLGGIQLGGFCDRVHVVENIIQGGNGQGITLGSIEVVDDQGKPTHHRVGHPGGVDPCTPCKPGDGNVPPDGPDPGTHNVSAGPLFEIYIERNRILNMGLDGIGVVGFWDLTLVDEMISVWRLKIADNEIRYCLQRELAQPADVMLGSMGYGGISLADVEMLEVNHNVIEDNGQDSTQPVCGIFVLHGVGIDIADNRILDNGWRSEQSISQAKKGLRGGIIIVYAVAPTEPVNITVLGKTLWAQPEQNGVPALRVHDNVVNTPLGRALSVVALGPVSVQGNALGTKGVEPILDNLSSDLIAATVFIFDLGLSDEVYLQLLLFEVLASQPPSPDMVNESAAAVTITGAGLDDAFFGRALADGTVQFDDNQVELDLTQSPEAEKTGGLSTHGMIGIGGRSFAFSSIMILTLDDVSFQDNQCVCTLLGDIVLVNALVIGYSLRVHSNRFTESLILSLFSAITFGLANMTTHNQATRCIIALPAPPPTVRTPNTILHPNAYCERFVKDPQFLGRRQMLAGAIQ